MAKLKQGYGNWVDGEMFWGREDDLEILRNLIAEGANLLLVAQRRMGKTSLLHEVARKLGGQYTCVYIDLQQAKSAPDAVVAMSLAIQPHKALWTRVTGLFRNALGAIANAIESVSLLEVGVKLRAGLTEGDWASKGDELFDILAAAQRPALLLIDELPILINRLLKG